MEIHEHDLEDVIDMLRKVEQEKGDYRSALLDAIDILERTLNAG